MTDDDVARIKATPFNPSTWPPPPRKPIDGPILHDLNEVKVRFEPLHPVWWQGRQWAVTSYGLECRDGRYPIEASRLGQGMGIHWWDQHVVPKGWVDETDFRTALLIACVLHRVPIIDAEIERIIGVAPPPPIMLRIPTGKYRGQTTRYLATRHPLVAKRIILDGDIGSLELWTELLRWLPQRSRDRILATLAKTPEGRARAYDIRTRL